MPGLVNRITTPRPPSSGGAASSGRGSTPSPHVITPEFKPKRLMKSASSNMLRRTSPSSPQVASPSAFAPERPKTRESSPSQTRFIDTDRRAASNSVSDSLANQPPAPLDIGPPSSILSGGQDRGRLLKRMSLLVKPRPASKAEKSGMSHTQARVLGENREYDVTPLLSVERVSL